MNEDPVQKAALRRSLVCTYRGSSIKVRFFESSEGYSWAGYIRRGKNVDLIRDVPGAPSLFATAEEAERHVYRCARSQVDVRALGGRGVSSR